MKVNQYLNELGTTTAGNSSQVSDGAAAMLLMTREKANELGLEILGTFRYIYKNFNPKRICCTRL